MKTLIRQLLRENLYYNCSEKPIPNEVINYVKQFNNSEQLLRNGGLPIDMLDRFAFGFSNEDITTISPNKLKIKWKDDYENVLWEVKKSGLSPKQWSSKVDLTTPIDVSYEKGNFYIEDGHHRYFAAKTLNKMLNVDLIIKDNPIIKLTELSYDDFHRCLFNKIKNVLNEKNYSIENTICNKMSVKNFKEVLSLVKVSLSTFNDDKKQEIIRKIIIPLENLRKEENKINSEIKTNKMSGDSISDEANTYWHQIQSTICSLS